LADTGLNCARQRQLSRHESVNDQYGFVSIAEVTFMYFRVALLLHNHVATILRVFSPSGAGA
jgi:hypothetical protein